MKNFVKNALLGSALILCATGTASANQLLIFVTAGQITSAVTSSTFGTACSAGLTDCGVYGAGVLAGGVTLTSGTYTGTSSTAATGSSSPVPTGVASWVSASLAGGYNGFEAGGSAAGDTKEQFISAATLYSVGPAACTAVTTAGCYNANVNSTVLSGIAAMNSTTQIGFLVTFANTVAAGTTANISLELLAAQLTGSNSTNSTPGLEGAKGQSGFITLSGTLVALPEPGSVGLALSGLSALAAATWRRRKQNQSNQ